MNIVFPLLALIFVTTQIPTATCTAAVIADYLQRILELQARVSLAAHTNATSIAGISQEIYLVVNVSQASVNQQVKTLWETVEQGQLAAESKGRNVSTCVNAVNILLNNSNLGALEQCLLPSSLIDLQRNLLLYNNINLNVTAGAENCIVNRNSSEPLINCLERQLFVNEVAFVINVNVIARGINTTRNEYASCVETQLGRIDLLLSGLREKYRVCLEKKCVSLGRFMRKLLKSNQ